MVKRADWTIGRILNYEVYENFEDFLEKESRIVRASFYMATTKARHIYLEVAYEPDGYLDVRQGKYRYP